MNRHQRRVEFAQLPRKKRLPNFADRCNGLSLDLRAKRLRHADARKAAA